VELLATGGIAGDRIVHVRDRDGLVTSRTHHQLLTVPARTEADGSVSIAGHPWASAEALAAVRAAGGDELELVASTAPERFDVLDLLVATDGALERFGHDLRRLRPNLVIAGVGPDEEATWPGRALAIGDALIGLHSVRQRCIMTSIDPDTGEQDIEVTRRIGRLFRNRIALNSWVIRPGTVHVGDRVVLVDTDAVPGRTGGSLGGWIVGAPYRPVR
jgi:uncharacterized protein YcbX